MKPLHKLLSFALDILLASLLLLGFAYIHHGRAFLRGETAVDPSAAVPLPSAALAIAVAVILMIDLFFNSAMCFTESAAFKYMTLSLCACSLTLALTSLGK